MQIYHYHPVTGEYLGEGVADPSPLEPGKYLIPAHATTAAPPTAMSGKVRRFNGAAWELVDPPQEGPTDPEYIPSLEEVLTAKMDAINEGKNRALDSGFMFAVGEGEEAREVLFDSDARARLAYLEAATQFQLDPEFSTQWKASAGQWVTMDAALFAALTPVYRAHVQACFAWQGAREQEVATALALEDEGEIRAALAAIPESM